MNVLAELIDMILDGFEFYIPDIPKTEKKERENHIIKVKRDNDKE